MDVYFWLLPQWKRERLDEEDGGRIITSAETLRGWSGGYFSSSLTALAWKKKKKQEKPLLLEKSPTLHKPKRNEDWKTGCSDAVHGGGKSDPKSHSTWRVGEKPKPAFKQCFQTKMGKVPHKSKATFGVIFPHCAAVFFFYLISCFWGEKEKKFWRLLAFMANVLLQKIGRW